MPKTGVIAFAKRLRRRIAFLTDSPLEAPLKGFSPSQPNLLSAIETWLEEV
ncbi:histidine kinase [Lyngbya sp. PCC 8106]|uniref:NACHT C-terminal alpha/beta 1 domain-containing protein n=1 Tax=Lyngbya sp. (strain PCC 8106) TaxID=313612 RepID=UPI0003130377